MQAKRQEWERHLSAFPAASGPLAGCRILVVEDEALVAMDLEMTLTEAGATVIGPCFRLSRATEAIRSEAIDAALLDIRLGSEESFPIADELGARGLAVVFHSAHAGEGALVRRYPEAGHCPKPCTPAMVVAVLRNAIDAARASNR